MSGGNTGHRLVGVCEMSYIAVSISVNGDSLVKVGATGIAITPADVAVCTEICGLFGSRKPTMDVEPCGFPGSGFTKFYIEPMGSFLKIRLVCSYKKRIDAAVKENGWTSASYSTPY